MLTTDLLIDDEAGTPLRTQSFSASFLRLFCLVIIHPTLFLASLLLLMHSQDDFVLPLLPLPNGISVCVPVFLALSLRASGNLSYSVHNIWTRLLPSVHPTCMPHVCILLQALSISSSVKAPLLPLEASLTWSGFVVSCSVPPTCKFFIIITYKIFKRF